MKGCPMSLAWFDMPSGTDAAHQPAECSARGICDYSSGVCFCAPGFEGPACERLACPSGCSGHGVCTSLRSLARHSYGPHWEKAPMSAPYTVWDGEKIFGCHCDKGFAGYDCSERICPSGDDPLTVGQVDEIQSIRCRSVDGLIGTFYLAFGFETTARLD